MKSYRKVGRWKKKNFRIETHLLPSSVSSANPALPGLRLFSLLLHIIAGALVPRLEGIISPTELGLKP